MSHCHGSWHDSVVSRDMGNIFNTNEKQDLQPRPLPVPKPSEMGDNMCIPSAARRQPTPKQQRSPPRHNAGPTPATKRDTAKARQPPLPPMGNLLVPVSGGSPSAARRVLFVCFLVWHGRWPGGSCRRPTHAFSSWQRRCDWRAALGCWLVDEGPAGILIQLGDFLSGGVPRGVSVQGRVSLNIVFCFFTSVHKPESLTIRFCFFTGVHKL